MAVEEIRAKHLRWINITNATDTKGTEIKYLKKNFNFHPLNLQDCLAVGQRPKIDVYHDHLFLVLLYPLYNRKTGEIVPAEIDFFVSKNYIITVVFWFIILLEIIIAGLVFSFFKRRKWMEQPF